MMNSLLRKGAAIALALTLATPALAATGTTNPAPDLRLVPLRAAAEAAGAKVEWTGESRTVTVTRGDQVLRFRLGDTEVTVNGKPVPVNQPIAAPDGRTQIPYSVLEQLFGGDFLTLGLRYDEGQATSLFTPAWTSQLDPSANRVLLNSCPGLSMGVAQEGRPVLLRSYGSRDCESHLPMTTDTTVPIGSDTKVFTAMAIMQLQEAGKLSVGDLVTKYLPDYKTTNPAWGAKTTIHHLLTHSAGLPALPTLFMAAAKSIQADPVAPASLKALPTIDTADQFLAFLNQAPLANIGEPGAYFSYSNDSYALLGVIIAKVSGQSYEQYVTEHILKPAGLVHTTFDQSTMLSFPAYGKLYSPVVKPDGSVTLLGDLAYWDPALFNPAGGMRSTVQDMLRLTEILRTGGTANGQQILKPESVKAMLTPYIAAEDGTMYGYGVMIKHLADGLTLVEHGGSIKGGASLFAVIPEKGIAGAAVSNASGMPSEQLLHIALNLSAGLPMTTGLMPRPSVTVAPEKLNDYLGTFAGGEAAPYTFTVANGTLTFNQVTLKLPARPVGPDLFAVNLGQDMLVQFFRDKDGKVFAMHMGFRTFLRMN